MTDVADVADPQRWHRLRPTVVRFAFACVLCFAPVIHAQVLDRASRAVRGTGQGPQPNAQRSAPQDRSSASSNQTRYREDAYDSSGASVHVDPNRLRELRRDGFGGLLFPPGSVLGPFPYANRHGGYSLPALTENDQERQGRTSVQLEEELGYAFAGAGRVALGARVQFPFLLDLRSRYSLYWEPNSTALALGRTEVDVRLFDTVGFQLQIGGMLLHFHDREGSLFGGGASAAMELFCASPWVFSLEGSIGFVGNAVVPAFRARVGLMFDSNEIYVGYHYEALRNGADNVDLGGVMLGVREWF